VSGEDILLAMETLGFEHYAEVLRIHVSKYREVSCFPFLLYMQLFQSSTVRLTGLRLGPPEERTSNGQVSRAEGVRNITSLRGWNVTKQDKRVSSTRKNGIGSDTFGVGFSFDLMISIDGRVTVMKLTLAYCYVPLPQSKCPPWRWKFELSHYMLAFI